MYRTEDVLATLGMIRHHKLDVRTVTMGVDLQPCAAPDVAVLCTRIRERLLHYAGRLRDVCREVEGRYGIPIVNRRIAVSPISLLAAGQPAESYLPIAQTLDAVAGEVGVDLVGGFTALVQKGWTEADRRLIASLPEVLSTTQRVCASVNVGTTAAGINMDAIHAIGHVLKDAAERTRSNSGSQQSVICRRDSTQQGADEKSRKQNHESGPSRKTIHDRRSDQSRNSGRKCIRRDDESEFRRTDTKCPHQLRPERHDNHKIDDRRELHRRQNKQNQPLMLVVLVCLIVRNLPHDLIA